MGDLAASLSGVSISRGAGLRQNKVLHGLDLNIERGEIVSVVGASGQGKTTLLHAIAGLIPVAEGTIAYYAGKESVPTALVFQDALLLPWLSVRQNIRLGFRFKRNRLIHRLNKSQLQQKVDDLLRTLGITELADRKVSELSGGQAQRVSIARTILVEPSLLLLDEPFSALDVATRASLQSWLLDLRRRLGLTIIVVTHDIDEAIELADRVLVLGSGPDTTREFQLSELKIASNITSAAKPKLAGIKKEIIGILGERQ